MTFVFQHVNASFNTTGSVMGCGIQPEWLPQGGRSRLIYWWCSQQLQKPRLCARWTLVLHKVLTIMWDGSIVKQSHIQVRTQLQHHLTWAHHLINWLTSKREWFGHNMLSFISFVQQKKQNNEQCPSTAQVYGGDEGIGNCHVMFCLMSHRLYKD